MATKKNNTKPKAPKKARKVAEEPKTEQQFSTDEILAEIKEDMTADKPVEETVDATTVEEESPIVDETEVTATSGYCHLVDIEQDKKDEEARINGTITTASYDPETGEGESHTYKYDKKEEDWVDTESGEKMFEHPETFTAIDATTMEGMEQREVVEEIGTPEEVKPQNVKAQPTKNDRSIKVGGNKSTVRKKRNSIKLSNAQMHGHLIYNSGNFDY